MNSRAHPVTAKTWVGISTVIILARAAGLGLTDPSIVRIPLLDTSSAMGPVGTFREGAFFADPLPRGLANRGSRVGGVEYRGAFTSGWFAAQPRIGLFVAGFPRMSENKLELEVVGIDGKSVVVGFDHVNPRDSWHPWMIKLPAQARAFRIHAIDGESGTDGWLAVSEPFQAQFRPALWPQTERAFAAFFIQALLLTALGLAAVASIRRLIGPDSDLFLSLLAAAAVALAGYMGFWIYFVHPIAGRVFSWALCAAAGAMLLTRPSHPAELRRGWGQPVLLAAVIGVFYLALLMLFEPSRLSFMAAHRFSEGMPSDNEIPRAFAERLWTGESPRQLWGDWLSSDRPPLQTGWLLLTWPVLHALGFDLDTASNTSGLCFQLLWVIASCALTREFGADIRQSLAIAAALAFTGVLLVFTVFVWPKLGSAALVVAAYLLWFAPDAARVKYRYFAGGCCAALGWLAHGGVAFSLLGLVPVALCSGRHLPWRHWLIAAAAFALLAAPWTAYQKFYEPPGNRLLKMHLAGVDAIDDRSVWETLRDSYRAVGFRGAIENKRANLVLQVGGAWRQLWRFDAKANVAQLRRDESNRTLRACSWWLLGLALPLMRLVTFSRELDQKRADLRATGWLLSGMGIWVALMFVPGAATIHQGTLVTQLLLLSLLGWWALRLHPWFFAILTTMQALWFLLVWTPSGFAPTGTLQVSAVIIAGASGASLLGVCWRILASRAPATAAVL